jgi:sulfite exporter TauE/SafE
VDVDDMRRSLTVISPLQQSSCLPSSCCSVNHSENNFAFTILFIAICFFLPNLMLPPSSAASSVVSDFLVFSLGLTTGFHCIGMCGGFVFSGFDRYSIKKKVWASSVYILTKIISYTFLGAVAGLVGKALSFTPLLRGMVAIVSGILLIVLTLVKFLAKPNFPLLAKVGNKTEFRAALLGLLNGFMIACGPLQAMYLMAASTASPTEGAKILFLFALGTLPVMFGLVALINFTQHKFDLGKVSAVVTLYFGLTMLNAGLNLCGINYQSFLYPSTANNSYAVTDPQNTKQTIKMQVLPNKWHPNTFVIKKGIPVKWVIDSKEMSQCTKAISIKDLNLEVSLNGKEQIIEFIPSQEGTIDWSCWMGMVPGKFIVEP